MKKISVIFGTRPEAVKLCPLVLALRGRPEFEFQVCSTGQHRELLDQVLQVFEVKADVDLNLMVPNQRLSTFVARAIVAVDEYLDHYRPDLILVQGDTSTVLAASLAAYHLRIKIGHVEAGLRTYNKWAPFPEEINRRLTSHVADYHFAPTPAARDNLLAEGIPDHDIYVTGNTVIDALMIAVAKTRSQPVPIPGLTDRDHAAWKSMVLVTGHRRENFGAGFEEICRAIAELARRFPQTIFVYPVHLNPNVQEPVFRLLYGLDNVRLLGPLPYLPFVALMDRADLVLTDSGGVQEEAPSLGKPVLVMRDTTERPEAVAAGVARLVGADADKIIAHVSELLTDRDAYLSMASRINPYGDGRACERIINALAKCSFNGND